MKDTNVIAVFNQIKYSVNADVTPINTGIVDRESSYGCGEFATITAIPTYCHKFLG
jgi:hypothetical protein